MAFIVGSIIGAGAALVGGAMSAKGAKKGAEIAAAGSQDEIAFNRESRDLIRRDQAPYREAGTTALNALMSMTGIGGGPSATSNQGDGRRQRLQAPPAGNPYGNDWIPSDRNFRATGRQSSYGSDGYLDNYGRAYGGEIQGRNRGGVLYNINELGPENRFEGGSYTRNSMPQTIPPSATGYIGRDAGGDLNVINPGQGFSSGGPPMGVMNPGQMLPGGSNPALTGIKYGSADYNPNNPPKGGSSLPGFPSANEAGGTSIPGVMYQGNIIPPVPSGYQGTPENPGGVEGGYNFQTDPGYNFRFNEGMRGLERGAAARGGLLSGGFGRKATRYGQDYASNEYTNVYNRIANIAGLGQTANAQSGNAALYAGANMGRAAGEGAMSSAYGRIGAGNAWAHAGNQISRIPWGNVFSREQPQVNSPYFSGDPYYDYSSGT